MPSEVSLAGAPDDREPTVEELKRQLDEAREQQAATAEILRVISSSPTDLKRVFADIATSAARLCDAYDVAIHQVDADLLPLVAHHGSIPVPSSLPLTRGVVAGRAVLDRQTIQLADVQAETDEYPEGSNIARRYGLRTNLAVPLIRMGEAVGVITLRRSEVKPFTERQTELAKTFADQAVIAIENTRLFEAEQASKRDLQESLEYQTATSEVLGVISRSKFNLQPVLDIIATIASRLCFAEDTTILLREGADLRIAAHHGAIPIRLNEKRPVGRGWVAGRTVADRLAIQVPDLTLAGDEFPLGRKLADESGHRTTLGIPLLRDGDAVGCLLLRRNVVQPFAEKQIALVQTFADQAVIAIENTRLFEAEQASKRELTESLEQQTATADVLKVISRSALDLQRVLDALVESAARLCNAYDAVIFQVFGNGMRLVAHHGQIPLAGPVGQHTVPLVPGLIAARAIIDRRTIHVADVLAQADEYPESRSHALKFGYRTTLGVPLVHAGEAIGVILIRRTEVHPFTERQLELVNTFADQAVIAIENTRLFEEVQARTRELSDALEQQTATSQILRAISSSPGDLAPVFKAILDNAARLCGTKLANLFLYDGSMFRPVASTAPSSYPDWWQQESIDIRGSPNLGRLAATKSVVHIADLMLEPSYVEGNRRVRALVDVAGARTLLIVPMLKDDEVIGAIGLYRQEVWPFDTKQIALVKNFADQAVIAIENTRLFEAEQASKRELARSVEELESLGKVSQAVNSSLELDRVLPTILEHACAMAYAGGGTVYVFDKTTSEFRLAAAHNMSDEHIAMVRAQPMRLNSVVVGECATRREVVQVADLGSAAPSPVLDILLRTGVRAVLAVPLLHQAEVVGVLVVRRNQPGTFSPEVIRLVEAFAAQSAIAVENARLFGEIAQKSRELEIASQHKSQFVANMSHELRTPLAAILGYAELMQEGFYEPLGQKSLDALTRIRSNGKHLLGLINTVLDIAKIESGQFTLNMAEYAIEGVVETVRSATESLAQNKQIALKTEVAKSLPIGLGDEQRLTQVLLNLVGNAIKFTDAGEVRVTAKAINGHFNVSVTDTGPGIPVEHQARIFEQFQQVDTSNTRAKGGTGLGLAIAKQIVEMHGGRIWVESTVGKGSTFQLELPTRAATT